jgi:hypothetical protein
MTCPLAQLTTISPSVATLRMVWSPVAGARLSRRTPGGTGPAEPMPRALKSAYAAPSVISLTRPPRWAVTSASWPPARQVGQPRTGGRFGGRWVLRTLDDRPPVPVQQPPREYPLWSGASWVGEPSYGSSFTRAKLNADGHVVARTLGSRAPRRSGQPRSGTPTRRSASSAGTRWDRGGASSRRHPRAAVQHAPHALVAIVIDDVRQRAAPAHRLTPPLGGAGFSSGLPGPHPLGRDQAHTASARPRPPPVGRSGPPRASSGDRRRRPPPSRRRCPGALASPRSGRRP